MPSMQKADRLHHIVKLLRARRRITFAELQSETGASRATLMRDLAWLRDRLNHPIHWDASEQCYRWRPSTNETEAPEEMAGLWFRPAEVLALVTLQYLVRSIEPSDLMRRHLDPLEQRLTSIIRQAGLDGSDASQLSRRIRVIGIGQRRVAPQSFETVGFALSQRRRLAIQYKARSSDATTHRTVSPQRLVYYRSNWFLDAWCHLRTELRCFSLDGISQTTILTEPAIEIESNELDETLGSGYGIFSGKDVRWSVLRFSPKSARWVAAEEWHPEQKGHWDAQGHWVLEIPYTDERELLMDVMRHVPDVEVMEPADLRQQLKEKLLQGIGRIAGVS